MLKFKLSSSDVPINRYQESVFLWVLDQSKMLQIPDPILIIFSSFDNESYSNQNSTKLPN